MTVEFVIVAPLFLFLVLGSFQLMGILHANILLQHANMMGLRAGVVHFESIERGWNPSRSGSLNQEVQEVMVAAVEHAYGTMHRPLAGFRDVGPETRPLPWAPAGLLAVEIEVGTFSTPDSHPMFREWLTSRTDVVVGLPYPWVGRLFELMQTTPSDHRINMNPSAADPLSIEHRQAPETHRYGMPVVQLRSDASIDSRRDTHERRGVPHPLQGSRVRVLPPNGGAHHTVYTGDEPVPATLPLQTRLIRPGVE